MNVRGQVTRLVLALLVCATMSACSSSGSAQDAVEARLPAVVNAPGTWSDEVWAEGTVAAIGIATRTRPRGLVGATSSMQLFTASAEDGRGSWLLPDVSPTQPADLPGSFAVAPDGRWIAWSVNVRRDARRAGHYGIRSDRAIQWVGWVRGWMLMDTTSGEVRELHAPDADRVDTTVGELQFSGDSRYLVASYGRPIEPRSRRTRGLELVAWDVESGTPTELTGQGTRAGRLGSAPAGVVWSRGHEVVRVDPATGERTSITLPQRVSLASWGPDGSFAYTALRSSSVHVGRTVEEAVATEVALPSDAPGARTLSWKDPTHLVVDRWRTWMDEVDLESGDVRRFDLEGHGEQFNTPVLATGLWSRPLREPVEPSGTGDPRAPWWWGALAAVVLGVAYRVAVVRRSRRLPTA